MYTNAIENYLKQHSYHHIHLKAVLFDMDGVLFNSMPNHARAWNEAMKHYGMHLSCEEAYLHEGRTGASTINIVSQRERGHDATPEEIERIYHTKTEIFNSYPKAERMPGAWEAIRQMKADGLTIMVVTGSGQASLLERLKARISKSAIKVSTVKAPHTYMKAVGTRELEKILEEELGNEDTK